MVSLELKGGVFLNLQKLKSKQQRSSSSLSAHRPPIGKMTSLNDGRPLTAVDTESTQVSQTISTQIIVFLCILIILTVLGVKQ